MSVTGSRVAASTMPCPPRPAATHDQAGTLSFVASLFLQLVASHVYHSITRLSQHHTSFTTSHVYHINHASFLLSRAIHQPRAATLGSFVLPPRVADAAVEYRRHSLQRVASSNILGGRGPQCEKERDA